MKTTATIVSVMLVGFAFVPIAGASHATVDCDASGWGDESCSSTSACNYDEKIGVHAYAADGGANEVYGLFTCSNARAECNEFDGSCSDISSDLAGFSGVGNCNGWIEDNSTDWNTFKLECFIYPSGTNLASSPSPGLLPALDPSSPATGWTLTAHSTGDVVGSFCDDGVCHPAPADCVDLGSRLTCWIV